MAKKPPLGSGARFHNLVTQLSGRKGVTDPKALAATIGAAKYGRAKMTAMAQKGRRRHMMMHDEDGD